MYALSKNEISEMYPKQYSTATSESYLIQCSTTVLHTYAQTAGSANLTAFVLLLSKYDIVMQ